MKDNGGPRQAPARVFIISVDNKADQVSAVHLPQDQQNL